jgi:formate-dependent nitrite reductase membrane component NrfD
VSGAEVSRDGPEGVRPGREAQSFSHRGGKRGERRDHPNASYYGRPIINPPVWEELDIAGYLFSGGLAGASSILAAGADLTGRPVLARRSRLCAIGAIGVSLIALVHDLGRPERFLNMLRVFKPTSPMSVGVWIISAYTPLTAAAAGSDVLGRAPRSGRVAGIAAAGLGAGVATYTAALVANTAVPAWHGARRELPFVFAGSAAEAAAGFALIATPRRENGPARRMAVLGALAELIGVRVLKGRLGMVAETTATGTAGRRLRAAQALAASGALGATLLARRSRLGAALSGAALLAGSALLRFGVFAAGMASAEDPRYTVEPQRERMRAREPSAR